MSKKEKMRECPVLGKTITGAECGTKRGPEFGCPETCAHNPWSPANYGRASETESKGLHLIQKVVFDALGPLVMRSIIEKYPDEEDGGLRFNAAVIAAAFGQRPDGTHLVGRWLEANARTVKNDERVFLRCLASTRATVLEVQNVVDDRTVAVIDLLQPERGELKMVDFRGAASARRFQTTFGFSFDTPHYLRMSGSRLSLPWISRYDADEVLRIIARHLGWREAEAPLPDWLLKHAIEVMDSIEAIGDARHRRQIEMSKLDWISVEFPLAKKKSSKQALAEATRLARRIPWLLESRPDDECPEGEAAFDAFAPEDAIQPDLFAPDGGQLQGMFSERGVCAGTLRIGPRTIVFEGLGSDLFERVRREIETQLASLTGQPKIETRNLALEDRGMDDPGPDARLVPDELLSDVGTIELTRRPISIGRSNLGEEEDLETQCRLIFQSQYDRFADHPIPALAGRTPRDASEDPELRPALIRLMKDHVRNCDNLRFRRRVDLDLNPLLEDLGLHELIRPAPPLPPVSEEEMERMTKGEDPARGGFGANDDEALPEMATLADGGLDPLPPQTSLSGGVIDARADRLAETPSPSKFVSRVSRAWPELIDELLELAGPDLTDEEAAFIVLHTAMAAEILFDGRELPRARIGRDRLAEAFAVHFAVVRRWLREDVESETDPEKITNRLFNRLEGHPQPILMQRLVTGALVSSGPGEDEASSLIRFESLPGVISALLAALWEFCRFTK